MYVATQIIIKQDPDTTLSLYLSNLVRVIRWNLNPFNTSIAPTPSPVPQLPSPTPLLGAPIPQVVPANFSDGPASHISGPSEMKSSFSTIKFIVYALLVVVPVVVAVLLVILCISKYHERKLKHHNLSKKQEVVVDGSLGRNEHFIVSKDEANGAALREAAKEQQKEPSFYMTRKGHDGKLKLMGSRTWAWR